MKKTRKPRRKRTPTVYLPPLRSAEFREARGKTIEELKLFLELDDTTLQLRFTDKTTLSFDLEPGLTVRTFLYDGKNDNELPAKIWPVLHRGSSWVKEPAGKKGKPHH